MLDVMSTPPLAVAAAAPAGPGPRLPASTAPRSVRLRPHHVVLRRGPDAVQVGLLPGRAVEVAGLPPPLLALLLGLHGAWPLDELVAQAVELGAEEADTRVLLADLVDAGALLDAAAHRRVAQARAAAGVLVRGVGPLLAGVATGLASAGVGTLWVDTEGTVAAEELGIYGPAAQGHTRADAVLAEIHRVAPEAKVRVGPPRRRPDLAVLTDALAPDPDRHRELAGRGVPQLVVRLADGIGLVGPLVLPGRTACLHCLDLHRAARDPGWPIVASRLAGLVGSAGLATVSATAALGVEQALLAIDGIMGAEPPPTLDSVLELDLSRGGLRHRRWAPHPGCGCGAAHTRPGDAGNPAETSQSVPRPGEPAPPQGEEACATRSGQ